MSVLSEAPLAFTFDDFTLAPVYSEVMSRKNPDTASSLMLNYDLRVPIISSPMNTITEHQMVIAMVEAGASAVLHRYGSIEAMEVSLKEILKKVPPESFFVAVGATGDYLDRARSAIRMGAKNFCIDVANGDSKICLEAVRALGGLIATYGLGSGADIMAGNVCTEAGAERLADRGATIIRVGIGPGSMCTTRVVTGHGVPQLTAIENCVRGARRYGAGVVADGGIRSSGDIVKALAIGADAVMVGGLLAGTSETPGKPIYADDAKVGDFPTHKLYAGMASEEGRGLNGWFDRTKTSYVPEGVSIEVPYKGSVKPIIETLANGLKVGMSYCNANNLFQLRENSRWVRVTENGRVEGTPHGKV